MSHLKKNLLVKDKNFLLGNPSNLRFASGVAFVHLVDNFGIVKTQMRGGADGHLVILISSHDRVLFTVDGERFAICSRK